MLRLIIFIFIAASAPMLGAQGILESSSPALKIHYDSGLAGGARKLKEAYPGLLADCERKLGIKYPLMLRVDLVRDHERFRERVVEHGGRAPGKGTAAIAFPFHDVIVLKVEAWRTLGVKSLDVVFQHEIVHCVLGHFQRTRDQAIIPTWFDEGLAQWVSEAAYQDGEALLVDASRAGKLIPFEDLRENFPMDGDRRQLAYAQSLSFVRFLSQRDADHELVRGNLRVILRHVGTGKSLDRVLLELFGLDHDGLVKAWQGEVDLGFGVGVRRFGELAFAIFILTATGLIWATVRSRRRRLIEAMDDDSEEAPEND